MDQVEGEWNRFVFSLAKESDAPDICHHVRHFFLRDETMNRYLGWDDDTAVDHDAMVILALTHGLSIVVRDKSTSELAGVHLMMDSRLEGLGSLSSSTKRISSHCEKMLTFIHRLEEKAQNEIESRFPSKFHAEIFITSVGDNYRGYGIAKEIYVRMITLLKARGFPMVRSSFTSPATRSIARKLGFEELSRLHFKDQLDGRGEKLFPAAREGEEEFGIEAARLL